MNLADRLPACRRLLFPLFSACDKRNRRRLHAGIQPIDLIMEGGLEISALSLIPGGTPLYRYVPPHLVGFLRRFGLKTGLENYIRDFKIQQRGRHRERQKKQQGIFTG